MAKNSRRTCGLGSFFAIVFGACFGSCLTPADDTTYDEVVSPATSAPRHPTTTSPSSTASQERVAPPSSPLEPKAQNSKSRLASPPIVDPAVTDKSTASTPRSSPRPASPKAPKSASPCRSGVSKENKVSSQAAGSPVVTKKSAATNGNTPCASHRPVATTAPKSASPCPPGLSSFGKTSFQAAAAFAEYALGMNSNNNNAVSTPAAATTSAADLGAPAGFPAPFQEDHVHYRSLLSVGSTYYQEATVAKEIGCFSQAKKRLEDCLVCFATFSKYACGYADFVSGSEKADIGCSINTVTDELAAMKPCYNEQFQGEEPLVADLAFLRLILSGAHALDNNKTVSYMAHIYEKIGNLAVCMQGNCLNGEKKFGALLKISVAAGVMAVDTLQQIDAKYSSSVGEHNKQMVKELCGVVSNAQATSNSLAAAAKKNKHCNARAPYVVVRMGSGVSGPTSGDSTPLSNAGAVVVSLDAAANEVAAAQQKKKKRTRRGRGKGKKSGRF